MPRTARPTSSIDRAPTGIEGLDALLGGGLPRGRATVLVGGPGAGKSVLALQALVEGARRFREPGILVAFEEDRARIIANASGLGWDIPALERRNLFLLNAQPHLDVVSSGSFDLEGLLSALDGIVRAKGAKRIVFDAVDVVTSLLEDPAARRRELYRLHEWLLARKLTTIFTAKTDGEGSPADDPLPQMQFMVDCVIKLVAETTDGLSHRYLRVTKYRGSDFVANDSPMVIGATGVEVVGQPGLSPSIVPASSERLSTGVQRLDAMLNGGYFRGSTTL
ncbi:MAG: ATPase domain-containing protein, partial [Gemmatimonadota bacterium]